MKTFKRSVLHILLILVLALSLLLSSCGKNDGSRYQVWMIMKSTDTEFWIAAIAGANAAKAEYDVDLKTMGPETEEEFEVQNEYIRQAAREGVDAIVFSAISYTENAAAIDEAAAAGVKVVVIDSDVDSEKVETRIGTDNVQAGRMTAAAVLDSTPDTLNVGIVNFDLGSRNGQEREAGLREVLSQESRVENIYTVNVRTDPDAAMAGALQLIEDHPEINALVGLNEPLAVGVARAGEWAAASGNPNLSVVCFDSNPECVDLMRRGYVSALIVQNPYAMGYLGVEQARMLLSGQRIEKKDFLDTGTTIITPENMFSPEGQKILFPFG